MLKNTFFFLAIYSAIFLYPLILHASLNETLPAYHWSYKYIHELQSRGFCLDLGQMNLPYMRGDVAASIIKAKSILKDEKNFDLHVQDILKRLLLEFDTEIQTLETDAEICDKIQARSLLQSFVDKDNNADVVYRGIYRGGIGVALGKNVYAFSGVNFDQYDYHDPNYKGYKWRGFAGYTEQAYVNLNWQRFKLKFGRDFLKWGVGESGTLVLSNATRPLDHLYASACFGPFKFSFIASELDRFNLEIRRFLCGHRLEISLLRGRVQAAVSEIVVYGGENATFNTVYLNPVIFYHGAKKNGAGDNNVLPTIDFLIYPKEDLQIYSSVLIDDIQVEKTGPGDLEPNEIAWLAGIKWSDPAGIKGMAVNAEYVQVANRTYKTPHPHEVFTHRGVPLGHPLGNDFDYWQIGFSRWFRKGLWFKLEYSQTRKGEGSLFTPWDEPWLRYTIEEGYSEPFPTGIVEKQAQIGGSIRYYHSIHWGLEADVYFSNRKNTNHILGQLKNSTFCRIGVWFDGDFDISLK